MSFALAISLITGLIFGLALATAEISIALILLGGAGLMIKASESPWERRPKIY